MPVKKILSVSEVNSIVASYQQGQTILFIANQFATTRKRVAAILRENGTEKRSHCEQQRKYRLNEAFFDKIDTEAKAYFLGLMYADGHNDKSGRRFSLALQLRDKAIVETFKQCLDYEGPLLCDNSNPNVCILTVSSIRLCARLTELGCIPRKSLILTFPDFVEPNLLHHFIRGYLDGDGWITFSGRSKQPTIGALGTDSFIRTLAGIITKNVSVKATIRPHDTSKGICRVMVCGSIKCRKFADFLYKDATIFLERKKERADRICPVGQSIGERDSQSKLTNAMVEAIRAERAEKVSRLALSQKYGVSLSSIDRVIYKLANW
ncbi:hypothetical protein [Spirosoma spitsbergense]|uniref:hypothetical protein n=1 Tax=Spirosoma spitsbergense TaxID=431554 RepID=UPI00037CD328|nr:hypothetical protein [Spirosoma spitsbergense]